MRFAETTTRMWAGAGRERSGDNLLFGRMYEDCSIEQRVFSRACRVFCIASAGDTALTLASCGHEVTAVDVNSAQIAYVRERLRGDALRDGVSERFLRAGRRLLGCVGLTRNALERFLTCSSLEAERAEFDRLLRRRLRLAFHLALTPLALRRFYVRSLRDAVPAGFAEMLCKRLREGFARHLGRSNPYARLLLLGGVVERTGGQARPALALHCAEAATFLENGPAGRFDAFSLSNILDGADAALADRLIQAVRHAASRDALLVLRTFSKPSTTSQRAWARRDRAMIWGGIRVERVHVHRELSPMLASHLAEDFSCSMC